MQAMSIAGHTGCARACLDFARRVVQAESRGVKKAPGGCGRVRGAARGQAEVCKGSSPAGPRGQLAHVAQGHDARAAAGGREADVEGADEGPRHEVSADPLAEVQTIDHRTLWLAIRTHARGVDCEGLASRTRRRGKGVTGLLPSASPCLSLPLRPIHEVRIWKFGASTRADAYFEGFNFPLAWGTSRISRPRDSQYMNDDHT